MTDRTKSDSGHGAARNHDKGPLLGRQVGGSDAYDPDLLFPVPRANARSQLPGGDFTGYGEDLWQCYELSWVGVGESPRSLLGIISVPAASPNIVESKSLKLYLNSLNSQHFDSDDAAKRCIEADLAAVAGDVVTLELFEVDDPAFAGTRLDSESLDDLSVAPAPEIDAALIKVSEGEGSHVHTHRLRTLCPVTAQPDWGTLVVETRGVAADKQGLTAYLLAFRNHQEFHEQCVERIYTDLQEALEPAFLSVYALYTRRGGLAICPWRCSESLPAPRLRLNRQ